MPENSSESFGYREYTGVNNTLASVQTSSADYASPEFYAAREQTVASPVQSFEPASVSQVQSHYDDGNVVQRYDSGSALMQEYRGPQDIEQANEAANAQVDTANATETKSTRRGIAGLGSIGVAVGGWLLKLKGLAFLLKFGVAGFSALISVAFYSLIFGWAFAVGFVALIFIHEMGHVVAMRVKNIPIGGMLFVPFVGAAVAWKGRPHSARDEAEVGIAGPIAGALASTVCLIIAEALKSHNTLWAPLAYIGFFLNLLNLVPVRPLDGGSVVAAIDRRIWIVGFLGLLALQIWSWMNGNPSFWLLLIVIMAASQLWSRGVSGKNAYYDVPLRTRIILTVLYFGLLAVLFMGMSVAHGLMPIASLQ